MMAKPEWWESPKEELELLADDITVTYSGALLSNECESIIVVAETTDLWPLRPNIEAIASANGLTLNRSYETHRCELILR